MTFTVAAATRDFGTVAADALTPVIGRLARGWVAVTGDLRFLDEILGQLADIPAYELDCIAPVVHELRRAAVARAPDDRQVRLASCEQLERVQARLASPALDRPMA
jgi:hypothetical protein